MTRDEFTPQLSLQLNVDNVLDKTDYSQIRFFSQSACGAPRNASLLLKYRF